MSDWFTRVWASTRDWWSNLPANVRLLVLGSLAALVVAGGVAFSAAGDQQAGDWVPLPGQPYTTADLAAVLEGLDEAGVPYRQGGVDGLTVLVARDNLLRGQLAVAQAGVNQGPPGWELFDQTSLTATDFDRRVMWLRAKQGELSRAIGSLDPLKNANVQLSIPEESAFVRDQKPVRAAVMVEPKAGRSLTNREVEGIVAFLTGTVPGLEAENVVVIDNTGRPLTRGASEEGDFTPEASRQLQAQLEYKRALEEGLQAALDRILGPGNASVMVNVALDFDSERVESTEYSQPQVRSREEFVETFEGTGASQGTASAMGADANTLSPPTYQSADGGGSSSSYERENNVVNYELNEVTTLAVKAPGRVEEITVGIFLNETPLQALGEEVDQALTNLQQAVARSVGAPMENVTIAAIPFDNPLLEAFREQPEPAEPTEEPINWTVVALGGAGGLLLLVVLLLMLRRRRAMPPAMELAGPGVELEAAPTDEVAAAQEQPRGAPEREPTPEEMMELLGDEFLQKAADPVRKKLRQEVQRLVEKDPEAVAQLVRAWLAEEQ